MTEAALTIDAAAEATHKPPSLEVVALTKRFGSFVALDNVEMRVQSGAFHALLGENGAGKSTLVKCVIGYQPPTVGDIVFDGRARQFHSTREAHTAGIGMVYQHFTLVPNMTVAENLVLVRDEIPKVVNWKQELSDLEAFMERMPFRVPVRSLVKDLSAGEKQKLEILKQLYLKRRFLILDEPTSVLTPNEADEVLGVVKQMTEEQKLTVLIITHKFREVTQFCDWVTVLRRGKSIGTAKSSEITTQEMAAMMVGSETKTVTAVRETQAQQETLLDIKNLKALDATGALCLHDLSLGVRAGEIVGVAGVSGNGQSQLVQVLCGQRPRESGSVRVAGVDFRATRAQMRNLKVNVLPEVPLANACVPDMSVTENIALRTFDLPPIRYGKWFVSRAAMSKYSTELIGRYRVKASSSEAKMRSLSGGNVQRAVLSRELFDVPKVLIVQNPCFGLDFAATADIRAQIVAARNAGTAVLLISEDLDEILELADRVCVMFEGRITYDVPRAEVDIPTVGRYMAGH